ncbi:MAG: N-acetylneuraminate synthase [Bacteroidales bacterium]
MNKTIIIAEAGVNHNGSLETAMQLVEKAAEAGADYVKFQTFRTENLVTASAHKADYQIQNTGNSDSQFAMLKKLELSEADHLALQKHCKAHHIKFISTPFDLESIDFLADLGMDFFKIPSGEITNYPYLKRIARKGLPVVLSSGMATMEDIANTLSVLERFGLDRKQISLLHCTTEYPTPMNEVNLKAMDTLRKTFNLPVGYSDHTQGIEVAIAATALGAAIIEKHFTLDRNMEGPDHIASLEPQELKAMVQAIRHIEKALGDGDKKPMPSETKNKAIARKSIVAKRPISENEILTEENLTVKRPGDGISPMRWEEVVGTKARRAFNTDEKIEL